jgi:hypothetical protein
VTVRNAAAVTSFATFMVPSLANERTGVIHLTRILLPSFYKAPRSFAKVLCFSADASRGSRRALASSREREGPWD